MFVFKKLLKHSKSAKILALTLGIFYMTTASATGPTLILNEPQCRDAGGPGTSPSDSYLEEQLDSSNIQRIYELFYNGPRTSRRILLDAENNFTSSHRGRKFFVPRVFLKHIVAQVQSALDQNFGAYLFFPDFGHGHLQAPAYVTNLNLEYFFKKNDFAILYHTVEDYLEPDRFRATNRNFYSTNQDFSVRALYPQEGSTVFEVPGYKKSDFGFYITGNQNGCFSVMKDNVEHFFDIRI